LISKGENQRQIYILKLQQSVVYIIRTIGSPGYKSAVYYLMIIWVQSLSLCIEFSFKHFPLGP